MGAVVPGCCAARLAVLPPDIKNILPPNIVALISPALVVLAVLAQYVRQPALKDKADKLKEPQQ